MSDRERDFFLRLLELGRQSELGELLDEGLAILVELCDATVGHLRLDHGDARLERSVAREGEATVSASVVESVLRTGEPCLTDSASADPDLGERDSVRSLQIEAVICVPLRLPSRPEPLGVLYLHRSITTGGFEPAAMTDAQRVADVLTPLAYRFLLEKSRTQDPTAAVRASLEVHDSLIGRSRAIAQVLKQVRRYAGKSGHVLVTGPTGTGKSVVADLLWRNGPRREGPFVKVDCGAIADHLLESELFGTRAGAYTDAQNRPGLIQAADGGVLFLDEIGNLSMAAQASLLRFVEDRVYIPVGGERPRQADVRIIAATNRPLEKHATEGSFGRDLLERLRMLAIVLPPLEDRPEDIAPLTEGLVQRVAVKEGLVALPVASDAAAWLRVRPWPGNVRELLNVLYQALIIATDDGDRAIRSRHLAEVFLGQREPEAEGWAVALRGFKKRYVIKALARHGGNRTRTAQAIGVSRTQFQAWLKELDIGDDES